MARFDSDIAHAWAHEHSMPKGGFSRMFFQGDTIYSYGYHFPIARHYKGVILFTTQTNSVTTAKHISAVSRAISHKNIVYCYEIPQYPPFTSAHESNINHWKREIESLLRSITKARKKEIYIGKIETQRKQAAKYIQLFNLKLKAADKKMIFATDIEGYEASVKKAAEADKRKQKAILKKGLKLHPLWINAWRAYTEKDLNLSRDDIRLVEAVEFADNNHNRVRLRTNDVNVETSKGIVMPVTVARRFYLKYLSVVAAGGCNGSCNYKMLDFEVTRMDQTGLLVGCHDVSRAEIDHLAARLNWK